MCDYPHCRETAGEQTLIDRNGKRVSVCFKHFEWGYEQVVERIKEVEEK